MLRFICTLAFLVLTVATASSRTLQIGPGKEFANLNAAAAAVQPGDTIAYATGIHAGGAHVTDLQGTPENWITLRGDGNLGAIIRGGSNGFQLTDAAYLRIEGLVFEAQTGNGVNLDDGGTVQSPAHHIIIDGCEWRSINATGNNDMLKMSGIDDFVVTNCKFSNGAAGGSMIDMVGCHSGEFVENVFQDAGSNCIQAKGGTSEIVIQRNTFTRGGQRAINIGGSTGLEYFRPLGATYEARSIDVFSNVFVGGVAPIAFVGAIDSRVISNTIVGPERWAIRILQESVDGFQPCGNNRFINNIVVTSSTQPAINIGSNTAPETFTFSHNLWFNPSNSTWSGPNTPVSEPGRILNQDPQFAGQQYHLSPGSPARSAGAQVTEPQRDHYSRLFSVPRSIGAVEYASANVFDEALSDAIVSIYPNPVTSQLKIEALGAAFRSIQIIDVLGRPVWNSIGAEQYSVDVSDWAPGSYQVIVGPRVFSFLKK